MKTRKLLTAVIAFLVFVLTTIAQTVPSNVPTNGIVGYWGFNGNANDQSGNGNNGTVNGASLTTDRNGNANSAYNFDASQNTKISLPLQQSGITAYSISAWFKTSDGGAILSGRGSAGQVGLTLYISGGIIVYIADGGHIQTGKISNNTYNDNQWHHVVGVYYGAAGIIDPNQFSIYVDNVLVSQTNLVAVDAFAPINNGTDLLIGNHQVWGSNLYFNGQIDELAIFNRALTEAEISNLYISANSTQNLCTKTIQPYNVNVGNATHDGSTYAWSISPAAPIAIITGIGTNSITIDWTNVPDGSYMLQAIETSVNGCVSTAVSATINISSTPAPTAISQTFCTSATVANLVATGTAIKWYGALTGGTALASSTALVSGTTYYASQTIGTCESTRTALAVSINDPQIITSATNVCSGTAIQLDASNNLSNNVVLENPVLSGLVQSDYTPGAATINFYSWTYGLPGMMVYGDSNQKYSSLEANIFVNNAVNAACSTGLAVGVKPNSFNDSFQYNGPGGFSLLLINGRLSLNDGTANSPSGYWSNELMGVNIPEIDFSLALNYKLKIEIKPNAHIYCYLNDVLRMDYTIIGGIVPSGKMALITANSNYSFSDIKSSFIPNSFQWSTGETTATINPTPTATTTYWCDVTTNGVTCRKEITITVTPKTSPTFTQVAAVCSGATIAALPTTSSNAVTGTWSPVLNNNITTTYTFTPNEEQCATTTFQTINITIPKVTSAISFVAPQVTVAALPNVTIGTQVWTNKNLDVTTYRDGTPIPQVTDPNQWANLTTGAWCYYNNDPANGEVYGKLYNWYAVVGIYNTASIIDSTLRKQFAPIGWHVPSDEEWSTLINYQDPNANGGSTIPNFAGSKLKEIGTSHWVIPNYEVTNSSGFSAIAGGCLGGNVTFYGIGTNGNWWCSTEYNSTNVWYRYLNSDNSNAPSDFANKTFGFSVRLIKD